MPNKPNPLEETSPQEALNKSVHRASKILETAKTQPHLLYTKQEYDQAYTAGRRDGAAAYITSCYGKRCEVKDIVDFPEIEHDPKANRCPNCEEWEHYDEWLEKENNHDKS